MLNLIEVSRQHNQQRVETPTVPEVGDNERPEGFAGEDSCKRNAIKRIALKHYE